MTRIEHAALWVADLELMRTFYERYFGAVAGTRYENTRKAFQSYFLRFGSGARLEIMQSADVDPGARPSAAVGYAHIAFALGSAGAVDALTERLRAEGFRVIDGPRRTGDGYYESVVLDPEGNRVELTV